MSTLTVEYLRTFPHRTGPVVCPQNKWIWFKVPRTGGTSIFREGLNGQPCLNRGGHYQPEEYDAWLAGLTDAALAEYFVWTIVRNPYDRFVSALAYMRVSVADFCRDPIGILSEPLWLHIIPQYLYSQHCDYVGRYETLQACYSVVCAMIKQNAVRLPVMNGSERVDYQTALKRTDHRALVETLYRLDFEQLGYKWGQ